MREISIGTRSSPLALAQTKLIADEILRAWPEMKINIIKFKTSGDKNLSMFYSDINSGIKGMFTFELEQALITREIDFAVHSLKDLPAEINSDLPIVAYSRRATPFDALILGNNQEKINTVGSSSLRRRLQIKRLFNLSEENIKPLRGNINTRLKRLDDGEYSALVLAAAGLERLGLETRISKIFTPDEIMPAPGQGILACQGRKDDDYYYLECVNDERSKFCALAERSFSRALNAVCNIPVGAYSVIDNNNILTLKGLYIDERSGKFYRAEISDNMHNAEIIGQKLSEVIMHE